MIVGLYMIIPILRKAIESDRITLYFIILSFVFVFALPSLVSAYSILTGREASIISEKIDALNMYLPLGYSGYFVIGYYLSQRNISRKTEVILYVLAGFGICITIFAHLYHDGDNIIRQIMTWDYLSLIVLAESAALFVLCKNYFRILNQRSRSFLTNISKCTFGVYLIHILVMNFLFDIIGITRMIGVSMGCVLLVSVITFVISLFLSKLLNKIPYVNKYIV
jgi:surface polysaccharide O-acyltransferase-like enzyme